MFKRFLGWILIMLGGAFLIGISQPQYSSMAGSGVGTGFFKHHFQSHINFHPDPDTDDGIMGFIFIEADHPKTFMLSGHNSPKYERARFNWHIFRENESSGETWIDLNQMILTHNGESIHVNTENLLKLFGYKNAVKEDMDILDAFVDLLHVAKNGHLPPPRHHSYQLDHPLNTSLSHGASGFAISHMTLAWIIGWSLVGIIGLWKFFKGRQLPQTA